MATRRADSMPAIPCAGLAAQQHPSTAVKVLSALLALQASFTLFALALRPYISGVLNCIEVICGCFDVTCLALTMGAYLHTSGVVLDETKRAEDPHLAVCQCRQPLTCPRC